MVLKVVVVLFNVIGGAKLGQNQSVLCSLKQKLAHKITSCCFTALLGTPTFIFVAP